MFYRPASRLFLSLRNRAFPHLSFCRIEEFRSAGMIGKTSPQVRSGGLLDSAQPVTLRSNDTCGIKCAPGRRGSNPVHFKRVNVAETGTTFAGRSL